MHPHFTMTFPSFDFTTLTRPSLHFTSLHFTSLHFTSLHFTSLHFTSFHFTSLYFWWFPHTFTSPYLSSIEIYQFLKKGRLIEQMLVQSMKYGRHKVLRSLFQYVQRGSAYLTKRIPLQPTCCSPRHVAKYTKQERLTFLSHSLKIYLYLRTWHGNTSTNSASKHSWILLTPYIVLCLCVSDCYWPFLQKNAKHNYKQN
jgi:hypothetical protein